MDLVTPPMDLVTPPMDLVTPLKTRKYMSRGQDDEAEINLVRGRKCFKMTNNCKTIVKVPQKKVNFQQEILGQKKKTRQPLNFLNYRQL